MSALDLKHKEELEDLRDERDFLNELKKINKWDVMSKKLPVSFKATTGLKILGQEVFEYYYIKHYDAFTDEYILDIRCDITNKIRETKYTESRIIDLIDSMMVL